MRIRRFKRGGTAHLLVTRARNADGAALRRRKKHTGVASKSEPAAKSLPAVYSVPPSLPLSPPLSPSVSPSLSRLAFVFVRG